MGLDYNVLCLVARPARQPTRPVPTQGSCMRPVADLCHALAIIGPAWPEIPTAPVCTGTVSTRVADMDTVPISVIPLGKLPRVYPYPCNTLLVAVCLEDSLTGPKWQRCSVAELSQPGQAKVEQVHQKNKETQKKGQPCIHEARDAIYHNWFSPFLWTQILAAGKAIGWQMSASAI
jgi:hypothetical protein